MSCDTAPYARISYLGTIDGGRYTRHSRGGFNLYNIVMPLRRDEGQSAIASVQPVDSRVLLRW